MTQQSLKTLFTLDEQTTTFIPAAHNLTEEKAMKKASELENKGRKAKILDQPSRHKSRGFKSCELCKTAAQNLSKQDVPDVSEEEDTEDQAEGK